MKKTGFLSFGAMLTALGAVFMLGSRFPYFTYSIPAFAGLLTIVAIVELGAKWACLVFLSTAFLSLLTADPEAAVIYTLLLGYYPILKVYIEKIQKKLIAYGLKFIIFNAIAILIYTVILKLLGIDDGLQEGGKYFKWALLAAGNVAFFVYDFAIVRLTDWYMFRLHSRVKRLIKR